MRTWQRCRKCSSASLPQARVNSFALEFLRVWTSCGFQRAADLDLKEDQSFSSPVARFSFENSSSSYGNRGTTLWNRKPRRAGNFREGILAGSEITRAWGSHQSVLGGLSQNGYGMHTYTPTSHLTSHVISSLQSSSLLSRLITSHITSYLTSYLISSHLISGSLISYRLTSQHLISPII